MADGTRREVRAALGRSATTVPIRLRRMVWILARDEPLQPMLRITTRRAERHLVSGEQALVDVADDRVTATRLRSASRADDADPDPQEITWRELEVELVEGGHDLLKRVDRQLRDLGATRSTSASKVARALGREPDGDRHRRALKREKRRLSARSSAGDVVVGYLARELARVRRQDLPVRLDRPDSIHTMRVATRRLRSALQDLRRAVHGRPDRAAGASS